MSVFYLKMKKFGLAIGCYFSFCVIVIYSAHRLNSYYQQVEQHTLNNQLAAHAQVFQSTLEHAANQLYAFDSYLIGKEVQSKTSREFNQLAEPYLHGLNFDASFEKLFVFTHTQIPQVTELAQQGGHFDFRLSLPKHLNSPLLAIIHAAPMTEYGHNIGQTMPINAQLWMQLSNKQKVRSIRWPTPQAQWSLLLNHTSSDNLAVILGIRLELAKLFEGLYQQVFAEHRHHIRVLGSNQEIFNSDWSNTFDLTNLPPATQLTLNFFGQELELQLYTQASLSPPLVSERMLAILIGTAIALFTGFMMLIYLMSLHGRNDKINQQVIERTASLEKANQQLTQSSNQRVHALELKLTAEQKYKKLFLNIQEGLFLLNQKGEIIEHNPAFSALLLTQCSARNHTLIDFIFCSEQKARWQQIMHQKQPHPEIEWLAKKHNAETIWLRQNGSWIQQGEQWFYEGRLTDITQIKLFNEQLKYKAEHDNLTNLLNRHRFLDEITRTLSLSSATFYLIYIDLDRFKLINDTLGHLVGDKLLIEFARRMTLLMGHYSEIARLGGDEFAVLVNAQKIPSPIEILCEDILIQVRKPFHYQQHTLTVSGSLGVRCFSVPGQIDAEKLLHDADIAMYEAKKAGKDGFSIFSSSIARTVTRKLTIERALQHLDFNSELSLRFQPLFCTHAIDHVVGYEALLRWHHPTLGAISPGEFIPIAEESGKIIQLGHWICEQALDFYQYAKQQSQRNDLFININVSPKQLEHEGFVDHIIKQTHAHGLTPQKINIEITESAMMCEEDRLITPLSYLYELGFGIHIDDFGTGYSSLARLKALPLSGIKIDRSFIQDITHCKESLQLVQAICAIADTFNLKVTAEGIESKEQIHILQTLHCQQLQGFYLAKPLEALDAQLLLKQTLQVAV
ncbi:hypothetical protein PULV_a2338 [Pseudoalteromonas ulvae UL12]|uniref:putative bifunctional diguanylate cyclase/phosphodiesterase n=1 Tax=Pseudoalteromonas ulvae TaxID=107327 RepID=UPI00186B6F26|nr:EAL domain-containing protein [Pseudoalteromonas ulvae]MBE0364609.1 hypothetical protein [Pseudoalteromonas ulvae UL12]